MNSVKPSYYQVILNNQLRKGKQLDEVVANLAAIFKQSSESVKNILSQSEYVVKAGIPHQQALAIQEQIIKAGVGCAVKPVPVGGSVNHSSLPSGSKIVCPKCDCVQDIADSCKQCGVVFSKFTGVGKSVSTYNNVVTFTPKEPTAGSHVKNTSRRSITRPKSSHSSMGKPVLIALAVILFIAMLFTTSHKPRQTRTLVHSSEAGKGIDKKQEIYAVETHYVGDVEYFEDLVVPGYITIIDFTASWCGVCKRLHKLEDQLVEQREDIVVRKIDVSRTEDYHTALSKYGLNFRGVPHSIVYDADGYILANDGNRREAQRYIMSLK